MDHAYIKEHDIVDRYEMGKLSAAECASFEEHFVDCPECQAELTTAQDFRQALRGATREDGNWTGFEAAAPLTATPAWRWAFLGAAAGIVVLILPVLFLAREARHLNRQVARANDAAAVWRQRYEAEHQTNTELQKRVGQNGQQSPSVPSLPVLASVFPLNVTRGAEPGSSEPADQVVLSGSPLWVVLSLDLTGHDFQSYRATLAHSGGQVLWRAERLVPDRSNALAITLPSNFFRQDDYLLTLEGLSRDGSYAVAGHYSFRVTFKR